MVKIDLGRIPPESVQRVKLIVSGSDVPVSMYYISKRVSIKQVSITKILKYFEALGLVERIVTTSGTFWKWLGYGKRVSVENANE